MIGNSGKEQDMEVQSDGKRDKIKPYTSDKPKKGWKKKILIILGIVIVILVFLGLILPHLGRITPEMAMRMRCRALTGWYERVRPYMSKNNQKSLSLIEVCKAEYGKNQQIFPYVGLSEEFPDEWVLHWKSCVNDPNLFKKEVPYGLFQSTEGWLIRELVPGKLYKKMLMIDQDGKIHELREIPKEKYEYP